MDGVMIQEAAWLDAQAQRPLCPCCTRTEPLFFLAMEHASTSQLPAFVAVIPPPHTHTHIQCLA